MTTEEIVKSLREDCKTCSENSVCRNGLNPAGLYCANKDAADLIERLEKEKAALLKALRACSWVCRTFPDHAPAAGFATSALHDYVQAALQEMARMAYGERLAPKRKVLERLERNDSGWVLRRWGDAR